MSPIVKTVEPRSGALLPPRSRAGQFVRNSWFGTVAGVSTAFMSFFTSVIIAHILGVVTTGVVAYALWLVTVAATFVDLGAQASLARYLPELTAAGRQDETASLAAFLLRPVAAACLVVACVFAACAVRMHGEGPGDFATLSWPLIGLACSLQTLAAFYYAFLRGLQRFERVAQLTLLSTALQLAGIAIGSELYSGVGALGGYCLGSIVPAIFCLAAVRPGRHLSPELKARVVRFAAYAWGAGLASGFVWSRIEVFFLQRSAGSQAVGLFTVGLTLANLAAQGPMVLTAGLLPYFAESFGRSAIAEMHEGLATATRVLSFLVFPACFGLAAVMPLAVPLIYGRAFASAVPAATILVAAGGIGAATSASASLVYAMDRSDFILLSGLAAAAASVVAGLTVIPAFGLMGAAVARAGVQIFAVILGSWFVVCRLRCPVPLKDIARLLLAALICAAVARVCVVLRPSPVTLPVAVLAGAASYIVAVRWLGALPAGDIARMRSLVRKMPLPIQRVAEWGLRLISRPAVARESGIVSL